MSGGRGSGATRAEPIARRFASRIACAASQRQFASGVPEVNPGWHGPCNRSASNAAAWRQRERMFRMTPVTRSDGGTTLCLEGELKLPWLDTLEYEVDRLLRRGSRVVLDFQDVTLVSQNSIDTLRDLIARGVEIENATDWVRLLLQIGGAS